MRIDINLSSQPYEDARRFLRQWVLILTAASLLTAALVFGAFVRLREWRVEQRRIHDLQAQIAQGNGEVARAEAFLNQGENRDTRDKSQLLNELIARKAFSWTQVFSDLERLMPPRLHVLSIHPELTPQNELELRLVVAGESRERALALLRKMEQSPRFRQPQILQESSGEGHTPGDNVEFAISALYVPQVRASSHSSAEASAMNRRPGEESGGGL